MAAKRIALIHPKVDQTVEVTEAQARVLAKSGWKKASKSEQPDQK